MKKSAWVVVLLALCASSFAAGGWLLPNSSGRSSPQPYPVCPTASTEEEEDLPATPGSVRIGPEKQRMIGVRVEQVEKRALTQTLRLLGRVAPDETRVYFINATVDGWITKTFPQTTGSLVRKDEVLASFYSPEFLSAGQALLFALASQDRVRSSGLETVAQKDQITIFQVNLQQYKDALRNLGMGELQVAEMIRTRKLSENVHITSPASGFLLSRQVSPGLRFEKGWEFYRIADLSRVWILADVYEGEAEAFRPGVEARVTLPYRREDFTATVSKVLPVFDPTTRTLKVRLETDNPAFHLRPDMFVDVELPVSYPAGIFVPADAVLHAGMRKSVFVLRGSGVFEPREVKTGRCVGRLIEILEGLQEGERIAVSGNFLIDSESKFELAAMGMRKK